MFAVIVETDVQWASMWPAPQLPLHILDGYKTHSVLTQLMSSTLASVRFLKAHKIPYVYLAFHCLYVADHILSDFIPH